MITQTDRPKMDVQRSPMGGFQYLLLSAAVATFLLIAMGTVVRVSGAAQACPDWPACNGTYSVPQALPALVQYAHRALAAFAAVLTFAAAGLAWKNHRARRLIVVPLTGAALFIGLEAGLGAAQVLIPASLAWMSALHLGLALASLGLILVAGVSAFWAHSTPGHALTLRFRTPFARLALLALGVSFVVIVSGILLARLAPGNACAGWPLCAGSLPANPLQWAELAHRAITLIGGFFLLALFRMAWKTQRTQRVALSAASLSAVLYASQALVGALKASRGFPADLVGLHAVTTAALWSVQVVLVVAAGLASRTRAEEHEEAAQPVDQRQRARDFLTLTKPVIVVLLLVTTYAGMVVSGKSFPALGLTAWTLLGGALAAGGSGAINQYIDRNLDSLMQRTAKRPLAAQRMTPAEGLAFGLILLVVSFYIYAGFVNLLSALLALAGMIYYILLYSIFLKKATVQNIVIGGGAGAIPPLVGWAAVTGNLNVPSLFLFAIVFLWTPPHFWALALVRRNDYARGGVPMLPVVRGEKTTRAQIFIYTLELVGLTLLMPVFKIAGSAFLVAALVLGGALIYTAWRVLRTEGNKTAWKMYRYSSMYLALIFLALMIDAVI
ncbi:MAG TPA: heme o synthase [Anaerolineaceae bacterium]|nr:heme o synthase [Anaerolineaceae bacterium]